MPSNAHPTFRAALTALCLALPLVYDAALADVVAVVSAKSSVTALDSGQIADIFLGRVSRFPNGVLAVPIDQAEGTGARIAFYDKFAGKSPAQIKAYWSKILFTGRGQPPPTVANGGAMKKLIAANPAAIGYLDEDEVDATVRVLAQ